MKPTTPKQAEATISTVRALLDGDPLDTVHLYRGHLAIALGALDEARADVAHVRSALQSAEALYRDQVAICDRRLDECSAAQAERDEAWAALAAAEMARDVAWVRACAAALDAGDDLIDAMTDALAIDVTPAGSLLDMAIATDADLAAAIRAARGQS